MEKSKIESKRWKKRRKEALISFLEPIYTNKDLTLKANSKIKGMKIPCSKTETQSRVSCTKKTWKPSRRFVLENPSNFKRSPFLAQLSELDI